MPSTSETILAALETRLRIGLPSTVAFARNTTDILDAPQLVVLQDGEPGEPEVLLSPPSYIYAHRAEIDVIVELPDADDRTAAFDTIRVAIGSVIAADRTLGGLCDWVEGEAPSPIDLANDGAPGTRAATIGIVLHYATPDPLS